VSSQLQDPVPLPLVPIAEEAGCAAQPVYIHCEVEKNLLPLLGIEPQPSKPTACSCTDTAINMKILHVSLQHYLPSLFPLKSP
jgi:hypothetical protein